MTEIAFITITIVSAFLFYNGTGKDRLVLTGSIIWLAITGSVAATGYFQDTSSMPPRFLLILIPTAALSVLAYQKVKKHKPDKQKLIGLHVLRVPVEVVLYSLYIQKLVPVQMTFMGWNFDILIGLSAVVLLLLTNVKRVISRYLWLVWNITGIIMLTIIVVMAILCSPLPFQSLAFERPNIAVLQFPYVYLPGFVVPVVYLSHILSLREAFMPKKVR